MSAQLSQTLKDSKLSFKTVLERLYEKDAELVNKMIAELEINKPAKKTMTQDEKDERKRVTELKKAHINKFIEDMGGESCATNIQINQEKKKYDAQRRESKKVKADESKESDEEPVKEDKLVKVSAESKESDDDADPFELEEEPVSDAEEQEPPKAVTSKKTTKKEEPVSDAEEQEPPKAVTPKKTKKEKAPNAPKKAPKKDKSPKKTTDTDSDEE
jgi:hypothetical protein